MEEQEGLTQSNEQKSHNGYKLVQSSIKQSYTALKKTSELQKKIERQRDVARRTASFTDQQGKKSHFVSRSRLTVPSNNSRVTQKDMINSSSNTADQQPLVAIMSDESDEDEFDVPRLPKAAHKEITEQLIKDGYNLDLEPDDEDLDLIPPRPLNERCACCQLTNSCSIL
ncbi:protein FAM219A-like [Biomphalaria glabrata]|uniref:Protein FAM219A-like n=1 Tax=Biomphalaria glabrata TaxID=6526 RepID=A0A9W3B210_BIOGL|nr:protein FAM219A-like [Biomphalaria glabrata]